MNMFKEGQQPPVDQYATQASTEQTTLPTNTVTKIRRVVASALVGLGLIFAPEMVAPVQAAPPTETPVSSLPRPAENENQPNSEQEAREYKEALHQFAVQVVKEMDESTVKITNGELTATIAELMEQNHTPITPEKTLATTGLTSQVTADTIKAVKAYINQLMIIGNRPEYPGQTDLEIFQAEASQFSPEHAFRFYTVIQEVRKNMAEKAAEYNHKHENEPWKNVDPNHPMKHPQGYPTPARGALLNLIEKNETGELPELSSSEAKTLLLILQMSPEHFSSFLRLKDGKASIAGNGILGYVNEVQFKYVFQRDNVQFTDLINSMYGWEQMVPILQKNYQADRRGVDMNQAAIERAIGTAALDK